MARRDRRREPSTVVAAAVLAVLAAATGSAQAAPTVLPGEVFSPAVVRAVLDGRIATPPEWFPPVPQADPFYAPPPIPAGIPHGTLLRSREVAPQNVLVRFAHLRAWQILHTTTDLAGGPRVASGIVLVPDGFGRTGPPRVVSYSEAHDNLAAGCGPSYRWTGGDQLDLAEVSLGPVSGMLARGWAVVMSDFGNDADPAPHPFSVGRLSGPATLDALRAVEQIPEAGIPARAPTAIFGLAGGGVAAASAAEQVGTYAPERRIVGTALQGMTVDPATFEARADGGLGGGFVLANAFGFAAGYPEIDLDAELTPLGRRLHELYSRSCQFTYMLTPGIPLSAVFRAGRPAQLPAFRRAYDENRLGRGVPTAPVRLSSCPTDCLVPYEDVTHLAQTYAAAGVPVTIDPTDCAAVDFLRDAWRAGTELIGVPAVGWLAARFDDDTRTDAETATPGAPA